MIFKTQIGIVGAGPSGLLLSRLLALQGIDSIIVERQSRDYVEGRIRAGVLEQGTMDLLDEAKVGERMHEEGLLHSGVELCFNGERHAIDFVKLTGGKTVMVYGQTEVTKDLNTALHAAGAQIVYEAEDVTVNDFDTDHPSIRYSKDGEPHEIQCDFIAGCDGFHGISRSSIPDDRINLFERVYPFAWLGILVETPPVSDELVYSNTDHGFALYSMRSMTLSRFYLQCAPDEDINNWSDNRIWDELAYRLDDEGAKNLTPATLLEKGITPMRSFVAEPMRFGNMFLVGDAAHIVPPTGAKGLNLAVGDVRYLWRALIDHYKKGDDGRLERYSETCLRRVWKAQRFSWWLTSLMHRFPEASPFDRRTQLAELDFVTSTEAGARAMAENYVGLPFDD